VILQLQRHPGVAGGNDQRGNRPMRDQQPKPDNKDARNESGRISRSGTSAGISVANESSSGGSGPIPPGDDAARKQDDKARGTTKK
jgi:hypothetical protein